MSISPQATTTVSQLKDVAALIQSVFQTVALIVAGIWAYFKFFKGRTYRSRLEVDVSGVVIGTAQDRLLIVTASVKNVGLSDVPSQQKGSGLIVSSLALGQQPTPFTQPSWQEQAAFAILATHAWVEPGETVSEDIAVVRDRGSPSLGSFVEHLGRVSAPSACRVVTCTRQ